MSEKTNLLISTPSSTITKTVVGTPSLSSGVNLSAYSHYQALYTGYKELATGNYSGNTSKSSALSQYPTKSLALSQYPTKSSKNCENKIVISGFQYQHSVSEYPVKSTILSTLSNKRLCDSTSFIYPSKSTVDDIPKKSCLVSSKHSKESLLKKTPACGFSAIPPPLHGHSVPCRSARYSGHNFQSNDSGLLNCKPFNSNLYFTGKYLYPMKKKSFQVRNDQPKKVRFLTDLHPQQKESYQQPKSDFCPPVKCYDPAEIIQSLLSPVKDTSKLHSSAAQTCKQTKIKSHSICPVKSDNLQLNHNHQTATNCRSFFPETLKQRTNPEGIESCPQTIN